MFVYGSLYRGGKFMEIYVVMDVILGRYFVVTIWDVHMTIWTFMRVICGDMEWRLGNKSFKNQNEFSKKMRRFCEKK